MNCELRTGVWCSAPIRGRVQLGKHEGENETSLAIVSQLWLYTFCSVLQWPAFMVLDVAERRESTCLGSFLAALLRPC